MSVREFTRAYCDKDDRIAAASYFGTFAAFFAALYLAVRAAEAGLYLAAAPLVVLVAFSGVRLYVLQHDTGHASLFSTRRLNDLAGYVLSPFTLTPYRAMQYNHNMHHAYLGNLDHRETTEIFTMTRREWDEADWKKRLFYRLYRNPLILIPVGAVYTYFIAYRWPKNAARVGAGGVLGHNALLALWLATLYGLAGWTGLAVLGAAAVLSGCIGVFLVYLQHNFEDTYWDRKPDLDFRLAALKGSSALDLGWWWDLGTGNIAYHDIHHYNPAIPSYRLRKCHRAMRDEYDLPTVEWPEAIRSFRLKLWDEDAERLVPFPKAADASAVPAE